MALIRQLSRELFGSAAARAIEATTLATVDLPNATVRRHLRAGTTPTAPSYSPQPGPRTPAFPGIHP